MPRYGWPDWDLYVKRGCVCEYCGFDGSVSWQTWNQLATDHIIPKAAGGSPDSPMNKAVACSYCNGHKLWYDPRTDEQKAARLTEPPNDDIRSELIARARRHIQENHLDKWSVSSAFEQMMEEARHRKARSSRGSVAGDVVEGAMPIFGKLPVDPAVLAEKIASVLRREEIDDRSHWNKAVRRALFECADRRLCIVYPDQNEKLGEWLFDTVWFTREQGTVLLAAEVELGTKQEVLDDFQKLLVVKAPLKVMVYYADRFSIADEFKGYLEAFDHHVRGEHYLFVEMAPGPADRAYVYKVQGDGRQSGVGFSPLSIRTPLLTPA